MEIIVYNHSNILKKINKLGVTMEKRFGIFVAISLVVGIVIGSGIFFKADDTIIYTNGDVKMAILAWVIGGLAMIFAALTLAEFSGRIEKCNGLVDYFEKAYGRFAAYLMGWFQLNVYYTALAAILAYVSSVYTLALFSHPNPGNSISTWSTAFIYLVLGFALNYFSPKLAARFQVSATVIKLIPLVAIGVVGTISGVINGVTTSTLSEATRQTLGGGGFAAAVVACSFAYEGWQIAVTVNAEIKDAKKTLPRALIFGSLVIMVVYILFLVGVNSVCTTEEILAQGDNAVTFAATNLFGSVFASLITGFVVISCLGTFNGLTMTAIRIPYSLAIRNNGIMPKKMAKLNEKTKMPPNSALYAFIITLIYFGIWYGSLNNVFGQYIGLDEIPIVMAYVSYVFLYVYYIKEFKDLSLVKRYVIPILALIGTGIIIYGGVTNPNIGMYMGVSVVIILFGLIFYRKEEADDSTLA